MLKPILLSLLAITGLSGWALTTSPVKFDQVGKQNGTASTFLEMRKTSEKRYVERKAEEVKPGEPIMELPSDAKVEKYSRLAMGYGMTDWGINEMPDQGFASEIAYCENGDVYLKNPTSHIITNSYIKGHLDGDKIRFEFPQTVAKEYDDVSETWVYIQACRMNADYESDEEPGIPIDYYDSDNQVIEMAVLEDGTVQMDLPVEEALGYKFVWDESLEGDDSLPIWAFYSDYLLDFTPFTDTLVELPEGAVTETWRLVHEGTGNLLNVAFVDDEVYIQGFNQELPEAWVKGVVGDGVVTFESEQYMGIQEKDNHYTYMLGAYSDEVWDEVFEDYITVVVSPEKFDFKYDAEARTMDFNDNFLVFNGGLGDFYFLGYVMYGTMGYQGDAAPANPAAPVITEVNTYMVDLGIYGLGFSVSPLDVNGNLFDVNGLYYSVYLNGSEEPYVFSTVDYMNVAESMTAVPYLFKDDYDFMAYDETRFISLYYDGTIETVAVVLERHLEDGSVLKSEPGEYKVSSVDSLTDGKVIDSVEYYDMCGRRISNPGEGVFVKIERFADGGKRVVKVIK